MNPHGCSDARSHCGTQNRAGGAAVPAALSSSNVWVGFNPVLRSAAAPVLVTAAFLWLELIVPDVLAATREASEFSVPAGRPDEYMQAGAAFARELDPGVEISFWDSQRGSLSVSRIEGDRVKCILRASPNIGEALNPLGRFLNGRIEPRAQALFALAHEVGQAA